MRKLWEQAAREKTSVESYKLKVEFAQEVIDLLEKTTGERVDQPIYDDDDDGAQNQQIEES